MKCQKGSSLWDCRVNHTFACDKHLAHTHTYTHIYIHIHPPPHTHTHTALCAGDPHLTSLDGGRFTFNGWGEYLLMHFQTNRTMFTLQTRTQPVPNSDATELVAFAFAMRLDTPIEVRMLYIERYECVWVCVWGGGRKRYI